MSRTLRLLKTTRPPAVSVSLTDRITAIKREMHQWQLLAIATSVAGRAFSAAELLAHAILDADVRCVLEGATSPKQVGRRLRALATRDGIGLRLVCLGRENSGCIWVVEIHPDVGLSPDAGA